MNDQSDRGGRYGLAPGYTLAHHLRLVDAAARLDRTGKARLPRDAASIIERLGLDAARWLEAFDAIPRRRNRLRPNFPRRLPTPRRSPLPLSAPIAAHP